MEVIDVQPIVIREKRRVLFLDFFKVWTKRILFFAVLMQSLCFATPENIAVATLSLIGWLCVDMLIINRINLDKYLFSTFIVIGYSLTQFFIPVVFTLLEGKPVVFNLKYPYSVSIHSVLALAVLIMAHFAYKIIFSGGIFLYVKQKVIPGLSRINLYKPAHDSQVWIIGFIGFFATIYSFVQSNHYDDRVEQRDVLAKFLEGLMIYSYAPYFLLLKPLFDPAARPARKTRYVPFLIYTLAVVAVGVAGNSRGIFMKGITSIAIAYFLGMLINVFSYKIFTIKRIVLAIGAIWFLSGPLADLGISMVIVRGERSSTSPTELINKTLDVYRDKEQLQIFRKLATQTFRDWDENYFDNIFLARFSNLKFNDLSLEQYYKINDTDPLLQNFAFERTMALFPQPVLTLLDINIDKSQALKGSYGDLLYYRNTGNQSDFGGFRVGHFSGVGMATFGWWYLLVLFVLLVPCYFLNDLLFYKNKRVSYPICSLPSLISIGSIFSFIGLLSNNIESPVVLITYIFRTWPQLIILYILLYYVSGKLSNFRTAR